MNAQAHKLYTLLKERSMTIATAESCTGGMIGAALTSVPGMSDCYGWGVVTYANSAKESLLGVKRETLETVGAVSVETAREMAEGAMRISGSDMAISVTGIAGPGGGTALKPVGLVYIGIAQKGKEARIYKNNFSGTRDEIRNQTLSRALCLAAENIKDIL